MREDEERGWEEEEEWRNKRNNGAMREGKKEERESVGCKTVGKMVSAIVCIWKDWARCDRFVFDCESQFVIANKLLEAT